MTEDNFDDLLAQSMRRRGAEAQIGGPTMTEVHRRVARRRRRAFGAVLAAVALPALAGVALATRGGDSARPNLLAAEAEDPATTVDCALVTPTVESDVLPTRVAIDAATSCVFTTVPTEAGPVAGWRCLGQGEPTGDGWNAFSYCEPWCVLYSRVVVPSTTIVVIPGPTTTESPPPPPTGPSLQPSTTTMEDFREAEYFDPNTLLTTSTAIEFTPRSTTVVDPIASTTVVAPTATSSEPIGLAPVPFPSGSPCTPDVVTATTIEMPPVTTIGASLGPTEVAASTIAEPATLEETTTTNP